MVVIMLKLTNQLQCNVSDVCVAGGPGPGERHRGAGAPQRGRGEGRGPCRSARAGAKTFKISVPTVRQVW